MMMGMAPKLTPNPVLRQRILSVLTTDGPLDSETAKDRIHDRFTWTMDDEVHDSTRRPKWRMRLQRERNKMANEGLLEDGNRRRRTGEFVQEWILSDSGRAEAAGVRAGDHSDFRKEAARRENMWRELQRRGGPTNVERGLLRELQIYGGMPGVFVPKDETKTLTTPDGIAVSLLNTGRHYADEITETGAIYHYPTTNRPPAHDQSEIDAAKAAFREGLPVFVITPGNRSANRTVHRGYIEDLDDAHRVMLVTFTDEELPPPPPPAEPALPFNPTEDADEASTFTARRNRPNQVRFAFDVFKRYGTGCAVCAVDVAGVVQAAHLVAKSKRGSDDARNGLPLCANHHLAFDRGYWCIDPDLKLHAKDDGPALEDLAIIRGDLSHLPHLPHNDVLTRIWSDWTAHS
jgi:putative restriction endonuclease